MKAGNRVVLTMEKPLCAGQKLDGRTYTCELLEYNKKHAMLVMRAQDVKLTEISLDAIYLCEIQTEEARVQCTGRIRERYCSSNGEVVEFQVKNGFYKINIK